VWFITETLKVSGDRLDVLQFTPGAVPLLAFRGTLILKVLCIIPARGGSKNIPRKNLRSLAGKPLIAHVIETAIATDTICDVVVSTDDEEIARTAARFGAFVIERPSHLAGDDVTIDPVVAHALHEMEERKGVRYDFVVTVQPTSPLLSRGTLDSAVRRFVAVQPGLDTLLSAKEVRHLSWSRDENGYHPNYKQRKNRAEIDPVFHETGAFFICGADLVRTTGQRFGDRVEIVVVPEDEAVDIDSRVDWALAESLLSRKRIAIVVAGNSEIGLGHVYRVLSIASDLASHDVHFFTPVDSRIAASRISASNYPVTEFEPAKLADQLKVFCPDIIVNDTLDTDQEYMASLKSTGARIVSFEDLGAGADMADVVINALYPERHVRENAFHGHEYFVARDEFVFAETTSIKPDVKSVLITFGGTDPSDLTRRVTNAITESCRRRQIEITVVLGPGYDSDRELSKGDHISIVRDVRSMAEYMVQADIVFTSAGRTVYEIACVGTPAIVLAQNQRELSHFFASSENGFLNLGIGSALSGTEIKTEFENLIDDYEERQLMSRKMLAHDLKQGRRRVVDLILSRD
jgi:CMP-N-acetylneuraminic acid synthetase/spore coat polysaccharide biosynthesis predicted glycosyltransferase SpsG